MLAVSAVNKDHKSWESRDLAIIALAPVTSLYTVIVSTDIRRTALDKTFFPDFDSLKSQPGRQCTTSLFTTSSSTSPKLRSSWRTPPPATRPMKSGPPLPTPSPPPPPHSP